MPLTSPIIQFLVPFLLFWAFVGVVLLAWRRWRGTPWIPAVITAVVATLAAVTMRNEWIAVIALLIVLGALSYASSRRPGRRKPAVRRDR